MKKYVVRHYIKTTSIPPRVLRFERESLFQSTPHVGSNLNVGPGGDHLRVDDVTFHENGPVILTVEPFTGLRPDEVDETISEMVNDEGWTLASDTARRRKNQKR